MEGREAEEGQWGSWEGGREGGRVVLLEVCSTCCHAASGIAGPLCC